MVLGTDEGMALAAKLNLAALFIERTAKGFSERATPRFERSPRNGRPGSKVVSRVHRRSSAA
jgi:hypothetical protein